MRNRGPRQEQPLRDAVHSQTLEDLEEGLSGRGVRRALPLLRRLLNLYVVVQDEGAIAETATVSVRLPCRGAHKGLCPVKTPDIFDDGIALSTALKRFLVRETVVGQFLRVSCKPGDEHAFVMVGSIYKKPPWHCMMLHAELDVGGKHLLLGPRGKDITAWAATELASRFLLVAEGCEEVSVVTNTEQRLPADFRRVRLLRADDEGEIIWTRAAPRRGRRGSAAEPEAAAQELRASIINNCHNTCFFKSQL